MCGNNLDPDIGTEGQLSAVGTFLFLGKCIWFKALWLYQFFIISIAFYTILNLCISFIKLNFVQSCALSQSLLHAVLAVQNVALAQPAMIYPLSRLRI